VAATGFLGSSGMLTLGMESLGTASCTGGDFRFSGGGGVSFLGCCEGGAFSCSARGKENFGNSNF